MPRTCAQTDRESGWAAKKEHRVSWKIYTCTRKQRMAVQAMLQEVCSYFNNKMYRLGPDVSTGFCGLHYVSQSPPSPAMSTPNFNLIGYADAKPSEAIQPHQLPGLAVAVVFPGKPGTDLFELPIKQFKDYKPKAKGNAARRLAKWLRDQSSGGLQLTGFCQVADQVDAAICGLSLLEELPRTRVGQHYDTYRLYFESDHIDFAQAVALEYYEFTINLGVLRAGLRIPQRYRKLFVAMDRFPGRGPETVPPGASVELTPGARFLNFVREHSSTGQHIRRENESIGLTASLGTLDWWKPIEEDKWREGKSHPHFVFPDWLAAAALVTCPPTAVPT